MKAREPQAAASYTADEIRAYQTLGLSIGADRAAVKAAWKRLMKEAHPDQGGNAGRAAALNAARDVLLRRR
jgi:curved DNA-binding protein CbpA